MLNSNVDVITSFYKDDFNSNRSALHQRMILDQISIHNVKIESLNDVNYLKNNSHLCDLIPEFNKFILMLLTIPASSCTAERSSSAMRRLKTYLRSTMTSQRLNHVSILNVCSDMAKEC